MGFAGNVLDPEWEELLSLVDGGGEGRRGIAGVGFIFFLFDGGIREGGRTIGTGSFSSALYTRYMA